MINYAAGLPADNGYISSTRANINANCAFNERHTFKTGRKVFVEIVSSRLTFSPTYHFIFIVFIVCIFVSTFNGILASTVKSHFLNCRKSRRIGKIPRYIFNIISRRLNQRLQANLPDIRRSFGFTFGVALPLQIGVNRTFQAVKSAYVI